jgi:hypothetical protein
VTWKNSIILILFTVIACATGSEPKRDFRVKLYDIYIYEDENKFCLERIDDEGEIEQLCGNDIPTNMVSISIHDYNKERDFQDLLSDRCKKWKQ